MGLFSVQTEETSPLAAYESRTFIILLLWTGYLFHCNIFDINYLHLKDCILEPCPPFVAPHGVWVNFLCELAETAKYCSQEKVDMLATLLHR